MSDVHDWLLVLGSNYREQPPSHESSREHSLVNSWMEGGTDMTTTATPNPMAAPKSRPANTPVSVYQTMTFRNPVGIERTWSELVDYLVGRATRLHCLDSSDWFRPAAHLVDTNLVTDEEREALWISDKGYTMGAEGEIWYDALYEIGYSWLNEEDPSEHQIALAEELRDQAAKRLVRIFGDELHASLARARKTYDAIRARMR